MTNTKISDTRPVYDGVTLPSAGVLTAWTRSGRRLSIAIGIATVGRAEVLLRTITEIKAQTRLPDAIIVCSPSEADVVGLAETHPDIRLVHGPRGLTAQRNAILDHLDGFDVVLFLDDDFVPDPGYVDAAESVFLSRPDVAMTTGLVLADGISGPGLDFETARVLLRRFSADDRRDPEDVYNGYGCNMALRLAPVRANDIRFDERLPLYGWLEDVDFSRRLAPHGRIVRVAAARGVHLGVKSGRQSGVRLGYSQIANPLYLARRGGCSWGMALARMGRNFAANMVGAVRSEPYIDRRGRALGNVLALRDLITGRLAPSRILSLRSGG